MLMEQKLCFARFRQHPTQPQPLGPAAKPLPDQAQGEWVMCGHAWRDFNVVYRLPVASRLSSSHTHPGTLHQIAGPPYSLLSRYPQPLRGWTSMPYFPSSNSNHAVLHGSFAPVRSKESHALGSFLSFVDVWPPYTPIGASRNHKYEK